MSDSKLQFSWADVEAWETQKLITPQQLTAIRLYLEENAATTDDSQTPAEQHQGLNFITIAYYFGGFMILLAYTVFMGLMWEDLGSIGQVVISLFTVVGLWAIGYFLQRQDFSVAGGLLIFAGTGIVPLFVYSFQRAVGLWPGTSYNYQDFYNVIAQTWIVLEIVSIAVAILVIWLIRFPLISLLIAFWAWFLSMDLIRWATDSDYWSWSTQEQTVSVLIGLGMLVLGIYLQRNAEKDYSFWFYLFGHILIFSHLSALTLDQEGWLGLLYLIIYLLFVVASVWLQRRVFLVFGALGSYCYLSYLAFQVFDGALGFVFALATIGLLIVLTAVGYQKYMQPWLENQLGKHPVAA